MKKSLILCVDDEKIVLDSLRQQLRQFFSGQSVIIETAESGEEALEVMEEYQAEHDVNLALVITDMIMPNMKGSELLEKVHYKFPDSKKILLTGQTETNDILETISKVQLYRYFSKPWKKMDFNLTVKEAILAHMNNQEIQLQRDQLLSLNENLEQVVKFRTQELEIKNKMLTDSINYAKRIQDGVLMRSNNIESIIKNHFVFYRPLQIVSGDYYFFSKVDNKIIIVAVDCTGHGVPGALMSIIASSQLNRIVNVEKCVDPSQILTNLNFGVVKFLNQQHNDIEDGMDASVCVFDMVTKEFIFSGAKRPLVYVKNGELNYIRAQSLPIGGLINYKRNYVNHTIEITEDTMFYLFSDGYVDQFGGENGNKFQLSNFKKLIQTIYQLPLNEQLDILTKTMDEWMEGYSQTDDMLVIGFNLKNLITA